MTVYPPALTTSASSAWNAVRPMSKISADPFSYRARASRTILTRMFGESSASRVDVHESEPTAGRVTGAALWVSATSADPSDAVDVDTRSGELPGPSSEKMGDSSRGAGTML